MIDLEQLRAYLEGLEPGAIAGVVDDAREHPTARAIRAQPGVVGATVWDAGYRVVYQDTRGERPKGTKIDRGNLIFPLALFNIRLMQRYKQGEEVTREACLEILDTVIGVEKGRIAV